MKKLVCLMMVALIGTAASAASVALVVDPADVRLGGYMPCSTITINLVGEGFVPPALGLGQIVIDSINGLGYNISDSGSNGFVISRSVQESNKAKVKRIKDKCRRVLCFFIFPHLTLILV